LTEDEKAMVLKAGWRPGEPLPDLRWTKISKLMETKVAEVRANAEDIAGLTPIDPSTPPLDPPEWPDISELPIEDQERAVKAFEEMDELQERMNQARLQRSRRRTGPPAHVMAKPGAAKAIATAQAAANAQTGIELVDDISNETKAPFRLKANIPQPPPPPTRDSLQQLELPPPHVTAGAAEELPTAQNLCPRCGFDRDGELVEPTTQDLVAYLSMVDGKENRFRKQYTLFGGRIVVTFRSLLPKEVDAAILLADQEMADGKIYHVLQYARVVESYKMAAGIESIRRAHQGEITLPTIDQVAEGDNGESPFAVIREYITNEVFATDRLRSTVAHQWIRFNQLLQHIEAKADDPDFFVGTG
jgi:hypothetical protein